MSKKILFLKTIFQYLVLYFSNFSHWSVASLNLIHGLHPIVFGVFFLIALIFLTFSTFFYIICLFFLGFLKIIYGFLEAYQIFLTIRLVLEWFPALNPYEYPALSVFLKLTEPYLMLIQRLIPTVEGYNIAPFLAFIVFQKFIDIFSIFIGKGDGIVVGKLAFLMDIPTFYDLKKITEAVATIFR